MVKKADRELIDEALKHYKQSAQDWYSNHKQMLEDVEFLNGHQPNTFFGRNQQAYNENNPEVNVDLLSQPISHIENIMRSTDYGVAVHRSSANIDDDFLQVIESKCKAIAVDSDDKQQTTKAAGKNGSLVAGIGFYKVYTEYVDDKSFNQKIKFRGASDVFKILPDYSANDITFSDANFWLEYEVYTEDQYEDLYGDSELASSSIGPPVGEKQALYADHTYTVLKYWYKEKSSKTLYEYEDGTISDKRLDLKMTVTDSTGQQLEVEVPVRRKRTVETAKVKWIVTNGYEILDSGTWHNDTFPFVAVVGNNCVISGKKVYYGAIRFCKSSQLMYNFYSAQNAKRLATSSVTPWMAEAEQVGDDRVRQLYENSHYQPTPLLIYKAVLKGNTLLPAPERKDMQQPDIKSTAAALQQTRADIMSTLGIYDIGMSNTMQATGNKINPSGVAVQTLAQQGQLNNLQYTANFVSSRKRLWEIIIGLFPYVLDTPREESIIAQDGSHKTVWINKEYVDPETGERKLYDFENLKTSEFTVAIDTGPSFADEESEKVEQLQKLGAAVPNGMLVVGPTIARSLGETMVADELEIMKNAAIPALAAVKNPNLKDLPANAKAMLTKLTTQLQTANQHVLTLSNEVKDLQFKEKANVVDGQTKVKVALIQAHATLEQERMEALKESVQGKNEQALEILKIKADAIESRRDALLDLVKHSDKMNLEHQKINKGSANGQLKVNTPSKGNLPTTKPGMGR